MTEGQGRRPGPQHVERRQTLRSDPVKRAHHDAIFMLARAAELHDEATGNHVQRIRLIVDRIARNMGLEEEAEALGYDAMLHDVGKLMIPAELLQKPGRFTDDERRVMESHTIYGERLLSARPSMRRAACIARHHHECWDGSGYPAGLSGESIPLEARITSAADVLDVLVGERCYKTSWAYRDALERVCSLAGTKLDPQVTQALEECDRNGSLRDVFRASAYWNHEDGRSEQAEEDEGPPPDISHVA